MQANSLTRRCFLDQPLLRHRDGAADAADGTVITYLKRRFVPPPENFSQLAEHRVVSATAWTILLRTTSVIRSSTGAFAMPMALCGRPN